MAGNRKATEEYIKKWIHEIVPGGDGENRKMYERLYAGMTDKQFDEYVDALESGEKFLVVVTPNFSKTAISVKRNFAIAKALGHEFFQRIMIGAQGKCPAYLTPVKQLVVDLPFRRASQMLIKKISMPEHNKTVDILTGQPTGVSKGSRVSFPEFGVMASMGMDNCLVELMKYRGGDQNGFRAMNSMIGRFGEANLSTLENYASGVESTKTLSTFLTCAHLTNTLQ
jgi:hypothetical protein